MPLFDYFGKKKSDSDSADNFDATQSAKIIIETWKNTCRFESTQEAYTIH